MPGSTFKAITAAIGVESGGINPDENLGYVGLSWQKDASWGNYYVTTLTDYGDQVNLENALVYSDNIYFARAALNIGAETMISKFKAMGFNEEIPFEMSLKSSTYDDDDNIDSDIQLADTGYGQGQLLVNPVHLLSIVFHVRKRREYDPPHTGLSGRIYRTVLERTGYLIRRCRNC